MSVPPESIEIGKCYLAKGGQIRRVVSLELGMVAYHGPARKLVKQAWPRRQIVSVRKFAADAEKEVPCPEEHGIR